MHWDSAMQSDAMGGSFASIMQGLVKYIKPAARWVRKKLNQANDAGILGEGLLREGQGGAKMTRKQMMLRAK